jgi:hypothetical protein
MDEDLVASPAGTLRILDLKEQSWLGHRIGEHASRTWPGIFGGA